jgi:hypothetical protein
VEACLCTANKLAIGKTTPKQKQKKRAQPRPGAIHTAQDVVAIAALHHLIHADPGGPIFLGRNEHNMDRCVQLRPLLSDLRVNPKPLLTL